MKKEAREENVFRSSKKKKKGKRLDLTTGGFFTPTPVNRTDNDWRVRESAIELNKTFRTDEPPNRNLYRL